MEKVSRQPDSGPKKRLNAVERVSASRQIVAMRSERPPRKWSEVARIVGLSTRWCRELEAQFLKAGDPDAPYDSWRDAQRVLDILEEAMRMAADTYEDAPPGSTQRIGAIKQMREALMDALNVKRQMGMWRPRVSLAEREMQQLFRRAAELAREHDVADEFIEGMLRLSESSLTQPTIEGHAMPLDGG